jgi:hypothetical protein
MVLDLVTGAIGLIKAIAEKVEQASLNDTKIRQLSRLLNMLVAPLDHVRQLWASGSVQLPPGTDRALQEMQRCLWELERLVAKVCGMNKVLRFIFSGDNNEQIEDKRRQLEQCLQALQWLHFGTSAGTLAAVNTMQLQLTQLAQAQMFCQPEMQQIKALLVQLADRGEGRAAHTELQHTVGCAMDGLGQGLGELRRDIDSAMQQHVYKLSGTQREVGACNAGRCPALEQHPSPSP